MAAQTLRPQERPKDGRLRLGGDTEGKSQGEGLDSVSASCLPGATRALNSLSPAPNPPAIHIPPPPITKQSL